MAKSYRLWRDDIGKLYIHPPDDPRNSVSCGPLMEIILTEKTADERYEELFDKYCTLADKYVAVIDKLCELKGSR